MVGIETDTLLTVEQTIGDDGTSVAGWLTGMGRAVVAAPPLITVPCNCGESITLDQYSSWPDDHDDYLYQRAARRSADADHRRSCVGVETSAGVGQPRCGTPCPGT